MEIKTLGSAEYYKEKYDIKKEFNHLLIIKAPWNIDETMLPMPLHTGDYVTNGYIVDIIVGGYNHVLLVNDCLYNDLLNMDVATVSMEGEIS